MVEQNTQRRQPVPLTSQRIKEISTQGLREPKSLTSDQVQELCASVMAHIAPPKA